jgi:hypothetical protein
MATFQANRDKTRRICEWKGGDFGPCARRGTLLARWPTIYEPAEMVLCARHARGVANFLPPILLDAAAVRQIGNFVVRKDYICRTGRKLQGPAPRAVIGKEYI